MRVSARCRRNLGISRPRRKNRRHQQHRETEQFIADTTSLSGSAFLEYVWASDLLYFSSTEHRKHLEHQTIREVCCYFLGSYCCQACLKRGVTTTTDVEGHHPGTKSMTLSDYRHCVTKKFRQRAITKLITEVSERIILLCRRCHMQHHNGELDGMQKLVQWGIYIRSCVICRSCVLLPVHSVALVFNNLFAGLLPLVHQPPAVTRITNQIFPFAVQRQR